MSSTASDRTRWVCGALLGFLESVREPESLLASGPLFLACLEDLGGPRLLLESGPFTRASSRCVGSLSAMA